ncbi:hypothetical protein O7608_09680 [Solwaraspora sp. WMMA2056]|uniref:hypothetical protein n=1 Tax=Solwaraspora sp. WMMA2056 TaxID=3015161 RepID=UPI00259B8E54|nr:hypothetical protein [Solwaraspora sp. WMMA2056]WJK42612.1 hypothetical protein O7608_09680 [Solwaraspora sp. WMMA2056]
MSIEDAGPDHRRDDDLTLKEELDVACAITASFQASIQHADTKGSMLAVLVSGVVTLLVTQAGPLRATLGGAGPAAVLVVVLTVLVAALAATGLHLAAALRPRITPPGPTNRFAFPAMAGTDPPPAGGTRSGDLRAEAWALNRLLAEIALTKHRHIAAAIRGTVLLVVAGLASLVLSAGAG